MADLENNSVSTNPQEINSTPGPWSVWQLSPDSDKEERLIITTTDGETEICSFVHNPADAPVLAAAQEMLAALEKLCPLTHRADCKGLSSRYAIAQEEHCTCGAADARAAIAKAKGGVQ